VSRRRINPPSETITACRSCGCFALDLIMDLGETPLADRLLSKEQLNEPEFYAPLKLVLCRRCALVQITETVAPDVLFGAEYPYYSSVSPSLLRHFRQSAEKLIEARKLNGSSLVIEAASNDGYMLRNFAERGVPVLGIDPANGPAKVAAAMGIRTLNAFFTLDLARRLKDEGLAADVFLANNVLAHVADLNGFVEGLKLLLKRDAVAVLEVPYLVDLVEHCEFDTIYHQHLCYFSVTALDRLFRAHELFLNEIQHTDIHGGSLRLFVETAPKLGESVRSVLQNEERVGASRLDYYLDFGGRVQSMIRSLTDTLHDLKTAGKWIAGYGAAAKACTFMSVAGIDRTLIDYLVDLNEFKQGRYMSGNHLPIVSPERLCVDRPDYLLILAWNFSEEIMRQQQAYQRGGGRFIVPAPQVRIV
jgi:SAM-dependent methyltransferase